MYLSRLTIDGRQRSVRRDLADCDQLHKTLLSVFPQTSSDDTTGARATFGILFRVEPGGDPRAPVVLVQSRVTPDWAKLPAGYLLCGPESARCKNVEARYAAIQDGERFAFRLRASPTRKVDTKTGSDGHRRNGRRVVLRDEAEMVAWLERKARDGGFALERTRPSEFLSWDGPEAAAVPHVRIQRAERLTGSRSGEGESRRSLGLPAVLFEGRLRVTDAAAFRRTLETGVGSGKSFGLGLLSLAEVE